MKNFNGEVAVQLDSLRWFSQRRSPTTHFGVRTLGRLWPPNSNSAETFVQCTYNQVPPSYVYSFEVMVLTNKQANKQTLLKTSNAPRYATTLGNHLPVHRHIDVGAKRTSPTSHVVLTFEAINPLQKAPTLREIYGWAKKPGLFFKVCNSGICWRIKAFRISNCLVKTLLYCGLVLSLE